MAVMLERWNDERMDDLAAKVDGLGVRLDEHRRETKVGFDQVNERFDKMNERFDKMNERFDKMNERFDGLYRVMIGGAIALASTIVGLAALGAPL